MLCRRSLAVESVHKVRPCTSKHAVLLSQVAKITHHYYLTRLPLEALAVQDPAGEGDTPPPSSHRYTSSSCTNYSVRTNCCCVHNVHRNQTILRNASGQIDESNCTSFVESSDLNETLAKLDVLFPLLTLFPKHDMILKGEGWFLLCLSRIFVVNFPGLLEVWHFIFC